MSWRCELTGKTRQIGNRVSHSNHKTKRRFLPNLLSVTLLSDALGRKVRLRISANALKTVDHRGGIRCVSAQGRRHRTLAPRAGDQAPGRQEAHCRRCLIPTVGRAAISLQRHSEIYRHGRHGRGCEYVF